MEFIHAFGDFIGHLFGNLSKKCSRDSFGSSSKDFSNSSYRYMALKCIYLNLFFYIFFKKCSSNKKQCNGFSSSSIILKKSSKHSGSRVLAVAKWIPQGYIFFCFSTIFFTFVYDLCRHFARDFVQKLFHGFFQEYLQNF